jgi:hypothetical protein
VPGEFSRADRRRIEDRDDDRCAMCGRPQFGDGQVHHRQLRSQGGKHVVENGVLLCLWCHGWCHSNVRAAIESGYIVASWASPLDQPLRSWRGLIRLLPDGTWEYAEAEAVSGSS